MSRRRRLTGDAVQNSLYTGNSPSHSPAVQRNDCFSRGIAQKNSCYFQSLPLPSQEFSKEIFLGAEPPSKRAFLCPPPPADHGSQNIPFHVCCHRSNATSLAFFWIQKWQLKHLMLVLAVKQISKQEFKIKFKQHWDIFILAFISPSQVAIGINVYADVHLLCSLWLFLYFGVFCIFRYSLCSVWTGTTSSHREALLQRRASEDHCYSREIAEKLVSHKIFHVLEPRGTQIARLALLFFFKTEIEKYPLLFIHCAESKTCPSLYDIWFFTPADYVGSLLPPKDLEGAKASFIPKWNKI